MKASIIIICLLAMFACGIVIGISLEKHRNTTIVDTGPKLEMELVGVTPHGHQIYAKMISHTSIYVLVRASDGYPIAITK